MKFVNLDLIVVWSVDDDVLPLKFRLSKKGSKAFWDTHDAHYKLANGESRSLSDVTALLMCTSKDADPDLRRRLFYIVNYDLGTSERN